MSSSSSSSSDDFPSSSSSDSFDSESTVGSNEKTRNSKKSKRTRKDHYNYHSNLILNSLKAKLPTFSGEPSEFTTFRRMFKVLVEKNPNFSKIEKMIFLKQSVTGPAAKAIQGVELSKGGFKIAMKKLKRRYGDEGSAKHALMLRFHNIKVSETNTKQMVSDFDDLTEVVQEMKHLGINVDTPTIYWPVLQKFPNSIQEIVEPKINKKTYDGSFEKLQKWIDKVLRAQLTKEGGMTNLAKNQNSKIKRPTEWIEINSAVAHISAQSTTSPLNPARPPNGEKSQVDKCRFRDGSHRTKDCQLPLEQKIELIKLNKMCFNCLSTKHNSKDCGSKYRCFQCSKKHHSAICTAYEDETTRHLELSRVPVPKLHASQEAPEPALPVVDSLFQNDQNAHIDQLDQDNQVEPNDQKDRKNSSKTNGTALTTTVLHYMKTSTGLWFVPIFTSTNDQLIAMIDSGADCSLISSATADKLQLVPESSSLMTVQGINSSYSYETKIFQIRLRTKTSDIEMKIHSYPKFETIVRTPHLPVELNRKLRILTSEYPQINWASINGKTIDMIIGCDLIRRTVRNWTYQELTKELILWDTGIGPCLISTEPSRASKMSKILILTSSETARQNQELEEVLDKMWKIEVLGIQMPKTIDEEKSNDEILIQKCKNEAEFRDGKIFVSLPFNGKEIHLTDNFPVAKRRLTSLLTSLLKKPQVMETFTKTLKEQEDQGIIEKCQDQVPSQGPIFYIPLQVVEKPDSETTKIRIVIDASSHMKGELSLNDCLYAGPTILQPLLGILLRARLTKFMVTSDIEKAFHQVRIQEKFRDVARFIWLKDVAKGPCAGNYTIYRFTRLPFGVTCSPFLLALTIMFYLEKSPDPINEKIIENLYVDNLMLVSNQESEIRDYYKKLKTIFNSMHMNLREFATNSISTRNEIPEKDKAGKTINKLLGLFWDTNKDELTVKVAIPPTTGPTKRQISSFVGATYDPSGLIAPILVRTKGFLQSLWNVGIGWDDEIPEETIPIWENIKNEFVDDKVVIKRQIISRYDYKSVDLIVFSDASKNNYACCAYLRFEYDDGSFQTGLIMSKSRVKPNKNEHLTIPRMELMAIVIATCAAVTISQEIHIPIRKVEFFSDSMIALYWLMGDEKLKTYVYNQSQIIKENCKKLNDLDLRTKFHHCPTKLNPADIGSRGMSMMELKNNKLWFEGPEFLKKPESDWPVKVSQTPSYPKCLREDILKECHKTKLINEPNQSEPDLNAHINLITTKEQKKDYVSIIPYDKTNSFVKLTKIMSFVLRFLTKMSPKRNWKDQTIGKFAKSTEAAERWKIAKNFMIIDHYKDSESKFNSKIPPEYNSILDKNGLFRCVRRLTYSNLPDETKRPIILMKHHKLTEMIVRDTHIQSLHIGAVYLVSKLREKYWIPQILQVCRRVLNTCVNCKKFYGRPFRQADIAPLPRERVVRASPFENIGVDYLGPVLHQGPDKTKTKCWVMLVSCLITRNIHLETVSNNSTASFLLAMKRLFGRSGVPRSMTLDNAPAFRLGASMTNQEILDRSEDSESLTSFLARNEVSVRFITPYSPWQGGVYERMVGIVKQLLHRSVNPVNLDRYELDTMLVEIEAIVNSRPISMNPEKFDDAPVLRPIDLLVPSIRLSIPYDYTAHTEPVVEGTLTTEEITRNYISSFNEQIEEAWKLWSSLYLINLKESCHKSKNFSKTEPKVGQVVLVNNEDMPRHSWPLGWIVRIHKSSDGKERTATLKCKNRFITRSLCHLIPLEIVHENIGMEPQDIPRPFEGQKKMNKEPPTRQRPLLERAAKKPVDYVN